MIKWLLALCFCIFSPAVWAVPVAITSGEHAGFSRLVVQFETTTDWEFGRVDGGYELRTTALNSEFDFGEVFDFIPRTRIAAVSSPGPGRIFLQVPCQCAGDIFEIRQGRLVLDIKDGPPAANAQFETQLAPLGDDRPGQRNASLDALDFEFEIGASVGANISDSTNFAPIATLAPPELRIATAETDAATTGMVRPADRSEFPFPARGIKVPETEKLTEPMAARTPQQTNTQSLQPKENRKPLLPTWPPEPNNLPVAGANMQVASRQFSEQLLLRQLSRAAAQGLISVQLPTLLAQKDSEPMVPDLPADDTDMLDPGTMATPGAPESIDNLNVETAIDRDTVFQRTSEPRNDEGIVCLPGEMFEISDWGPPEMSAGQFSDLRVALVQEFDKPDAVAIEKLAKRYLFLGFGSEAALLLQSFDVSIPNSDILMQIAEILDRGVVATPGHLRSQLTCSTPAALWAALSMEVVPAGTDLDDSSVLRAFSSLPSHLRQHFGPNLVGKFLAIGDEDSATAVRNITDRSVPRETPEFQMIEAQIAFFEGDVGAALEHFATVAASTDISAPQALINLIDTKLDAGLAIDQKTAQFADALAVEYAGTRTGQQLTIAAIRAFTKSGQIETTFERINSALANEAITASEARTLVAEAHARNAEFSPNAEFLTAVYRYRIDADQASEMAISTRRAMANRLTALGLPGKAIELYASPGAKTDEDDLRLLAQAELDLGNPGNALAHLQDISDPAALQLQARAKEMQRDFATATALFEELDLPDEQQSAAWRGADWQVVTTIGEGPRSAIADVVLASEADAVLEMASPGPGQASAEELGAENPPAVGAIADGRALVANSLSTREIIEQLLETP